MKAAILRSPADIGTNPLEIADVAQPHANPGQVVLRVRACGVCRTDLHIVEGELKPLRAPLIPGHQIVGDIVEGATADLPVGARVGVS
jgi:propanol-preferring alcohol dehydrogenase